MLETSQMQRLVAVADHDTITEAAESLYLTQPALSRALRKIEAELGAELELWCAYRRDLPSGIADVLHAQAADLARAADLAPRAG